MRGSKGSLLFALFLLLIRGSYATAGNFGPLETRNQHPPHLIFLNLPPDRAIPLPKGSSSLSFSVDYSNTCYWKARNGWEVITDMEIMRLSIEGRYGLSERLEVGAEIPFLYFYGGFLDQPIEAFHKAFGLPLGYRRGRKKGKLEYLIRKGEDVKLHVRSPTFGISDVNLFAKFVLFHEKETHPALAIRSAVQLPTGDEHRGMGSGGAVFGFGFALEKHLGRFSFYLDANCHLIHPSSVFPIKRCYLFSGTFSAEYDLKDDLALLLQIEGNSSPFSTGVDILDGGAAEIIWGLKWKVWKKAILTFGVTEELVGETSADVTLTTGIRFNF